MTPKEKTVDIFYKYFEATNNHYIAKECALIAVNEIIEITQHESPSSWVYYMEVKKEIEAL